MVKRLSSLLPLLLPAVLSVAFSHPVHGTLAKRAPNPGPGCAGTYTGPLPNGAWPKQDCVPFVEDPQVQEWFKSVDVNSVPAFPLSNNGECPPSGNIAADRCWWPCQNCGAPDDITHCPTAHTWGLTLDDGPSADLPRLFDRLSARHQKTTFSAIGSRVISNPALLKRAYQDGHQIVIQGWSHRPMTSLTNDQIVAELKWTEKAIFQTIGVTPRYWRPPFGDVDNRVRNIAKQLGYTVLTWSQELQVKRDFLYNKPAPQLAMATFKTWMTVIPGMTTGFIAPCPLFPSCFCFDSFHGFDGCRCHWRSSRYSRKQSYYRTCGTMP